MKIKNVIVLLSCLVCISCNTQSKSDGPLDGSILWKISGNGLASPSYILGTNHAIEQKFIEDIKGLESAFGSSEQVIGEMDMGDLFTKGDVLQKASMMPDSTSYEKLLSESELEVVKARVNEMGGPTFDQLKILHPAALSSYIVLNFYKSISGQQNDSQPMDLYFQVRAKEKGKSVAGLETIEDQIEALFNSTPIERQAKDLYCMLENIDYSKNMLQELDANYRKADLRALEDMVNDKNSPCPINNEANEALIKVRNNKWLEKLPTIMKNKPSFIAVGCLHLIGEDGLLFQLRKMGYTVEPEL